jgi:serine/threonine protein kinase
MLSAATNGRRLCGRYTLIEKMGAGGQGEVWRARDESRGIELALKVLSPSLARSEAAWMALEREYEVANQLDHPSILKVHPPVRDAESAVLPMEIATGGDLRRLRGASYLEIVPVVLEIAQALHHAHERGIVHRDLKPSNVLFDSRGRVRLADFGVAAGTALSSQRDAIRSGMSPFTASPEQLRGESPAVSDDIYGLGALTYELLSGYPPYYPKFDLKRVLEEPVPDIRPVHQAPPRLLALVMAMLAKRPSMRPHSMQDVIDDLDATLNDTLTFDFEEETAAAESEQVDDSDGDDEEEMYEPQPAPAPTRAASEPPRAPAPEQRASAPVPSASAARADTRANSTASPAAASASRAEPTRVEPQRPPASAAPLGQQQRAEPPRTSAPSPSAAASSAGSDRTVSGRAAGERAPARNIPFERGSAERAALDRAAAALSGAVDALDSVADGDPTVRRRSGGDRRISGGTIADRVQPSASSFDVPGDFQVASAGGAPGFDNIRIETVPSLMRLEPVRRARRWPYAMLILLAGAAAGAFFILPKLAEQNAAIQAPPVASAPAPAPTESTAPPASAPTIAANGTELPAVPTENVVAPEAAPAQPATQADTNAEQKLREVRSQYDDKLAALDARGAGVWGGKEYATAKARSAESVGAFDAGNPSLAAQRLEDAIRLLSTVEGKAPQALAAQLIKGDRALEAGNDDVAEQAYEFATRIDPSSRKAADGLRRARNLDRVLPLLAEAANAESAREYTRAAQRYNEVLSIDPNNAKAREGANRMSAASGVDTYERAIGQGFAALSAGRLDEARTAFDQARKIRPTGREAVDGLTRVSAAQRAQGYSAVKLRASSLESEERWGEALEEYEAVLRTDPSLVFAQQGRQRTAMRKDLADRLQFLIDNPQRLAAPAVRSEALRLLDTADTQNPMGPVLRSQMARLQILLPEFDKPVRLALESDNTTQVAIQRVGSFGTFSRREIELKPGKYTVVGTRAGYRDVRRDVTIAPGQDVQIISVRCVEPI